MKFQLYTSTKPNHTGFVSCVAWLTNELVITCGDDRKLVFWNTSNYHEPVKSYQLPIDAYPTSMHFMGNAVPSTSIGIDTPSFSNVKFDQQSSSLIAIGATNGFFYLIPSNWNGNKIDKSFEAHRGSIIVILWSNDNSTLATAGEDGMVKIWSRAGMLRSTIAASHLPIYALSWSPASNSLVLGNGNNISIKSLTPQSRMLEWSAHDGLLISLNWSAVNNLILSAGEDGRVKIWDSTGRIIFISSQHTTAITSVSWSPDGEFFAISTFCLLKLHDNSGTCLSVEKLSTEGIHSFSWSNDSNQLCCICSNGQVFFSYLIEKVLESGVWQVTNSSRRTIRVTNVTNDDTNELLEFVDSVRRISFMYDYLIVVTTSQCFIYQTSNWITPHHFDIKNLDVYMIRQSHKHYLLLTSATANLYSYNGRFLKTIKLSNTRLDSIRASTISLNNSTLAYKDGVNVQTIHFVDIDNIKSNDRQTNSYRHLFEIIALRLSPDEKQNEQLCAVLDKNSDLYVVLVHNSHRTTIRSFKLSSMIRDFNWHIDSNVLISLHDNQSLSLCLYPHTAFVDSSLLQDVILSLNSDELVTNKNCRIVDFSKNRITIERYDNVKIYIPINPFVMLLYGYKSENKWQEAVRICNFLDKSMAEINSIDKNIRNALWATLAVMTLEKKEFQIAEIAYAAINKLDKVLYLNQIKSLNQPDAISAELELMCGNLNGAEHYFIQKGFILRAVMLNLELYRWERALELAIKYNSTFEPIELVSNNNDDINFDTDLNQKMDTVFQINLIHLVLSCRQNYLNNRQKPENIDQFKKHINEFDQLAPWTSIDKLLKENNNKLVYSKSLLK